MTTQTEALNLALEELAVRFSEGWHEGIKIDASDIMLLNKAAQALAQPEQEPVANGKLTVTLQDAPTEIELAQYKRMLQAACADLGAINEALGLDPNDGGAEPILLAIEELRGRSQEPMAWMVYTLDGTSVCVTDNPADFTPEHRALPLYTHPPVPTAQPDLIKNERDKLRAFAQEIMDGWPDVGMLDGFDLQELAVKHGLLAETTRHKPCVEEGCNCAEMVDEQDWQEGVKCYHGTDLLKGVA